MREYFNNIHEICCLDNLTITKRLNLTRVCEVTSIVINDKVVQLNKGQYFFFTSCQIVRELFAINSTALGTENCALKQFCIATQGHN